MLTLGNTFVLHFLSYQFSQLEELKKVVQDQKILQDQQQQLVTLTSQQQKLITAQQTTIELEKNRTDQLQKQIDAQKYTIDAHKVMIDAQQINTNTLKPQGVGHIEHGVLKCDNSRSWRDGHFTKYNINFLQSHKMSATFRQKYTTPPTVHLSVVSLVNYEKENYWSVFVDHVDTQGFVMRCSTGDVGGNHRQDYYHVYDMIVSWISFDD